jgi:hypothetical protein
VVGTLPPPVSIPISEEFPVRKPVVMKFVRLSTVARSFLAESSRPSGTRAVALFVRDLMSLSHRQRREVADLVKQEG